MIETSIKISGRLGRLASRDATLGILNIDALWQAERALAIDSNRLHSDEIFLPTGFPAPSLGLPETGFAPDYLHYNTYTFASRQFRQVLAQPEHVVQFTPIELVAGGEAVRAQDYRLMRVLAKQPALDLHLSDCSVHEFVNRINGERSMRTDFVSQFALLQGLQANTEIFRAEEASTYILVTDALAERILRAGCTGIDFSDPTNLHFTDKPSRYRGKNGIVLR